MLIKNYFRIQSKIKKIQKALRYKIIEAIWKIEHPKCYHIFKHRQGTTLKKLTSVRKLQRLIGGYGISNEEWRKENEENLTRIIIQNSHSELMCLINFVRLTSEKNRKYVSFKMRYKRHLIESLDCKYELTLILSAMK